jgi:peptidoglycan hydrolase-like protein with peptidoglycan-binding domain
MRRLIVRRGAALLGTFAALLSSLAVPPLDASAGGASTSCSIRVQLRRGVRSAEVWCLETRLEALGYRGILGPDAVFGPSTTRAVQRFQQKSGLRPTGIVDYATVSALGAVGQQSVNPGVIETRTIGYSVQGRPIVATRMGTAGGRPVLVIGNTHGDEPKGMEITGLLRALPTPAGIDLWIIDTINPDGVAMRQRVNANAVDLNRNFEYRWNYIPRSRRNHQYSGESPADQPETAAMQAFIREIHPYITVWYHQDANSVSLAGRRKELPRVYGQLVRLGHRTVRCSAGCTGTAGSFTNHVAGGTSFLVELPSSRKVNAAMVRRHAEAVLGIADL